MPCCECNKRKKKRRDPLDKRDLDETSRTSFYEYASTLPVLEEDVPSPDEGTSYTFTGYILLNCERFSINFLTPNEDVALHINPRLPQNYIVRNTKIHHVWGHEEVASPLPFSLRRGAKFTIQVLVTYENYMISVNGYHFAKYYHRLPYTDVCRVEVKGDVEKVQLQRKHVDNYPALLPESAGKKIRIVDTQPREINSCKQTKNTEDLEDDEDALDNFTTAPEYQDVVSLPPTYTSQPKEAMSMPYYGLVPIGSLVSGARLVIGGRIKLLPQSFYINLQHGQQHWPHPIVAFHFNPRFSKQSGAIGKAIVCRNAWYQGMWAEEERSELDTDMRPGRAFILSINCCKDAFKVFVNSKFLTKFNYHFDPNIVDIVYIQGDIKLWDIYLERPSNQIVDLTVPRESETDDDFTV